MAEHALAEDEDEDMDGSDLAGGLDDQDLGADLRKREPSKINVETPDMDRYADENWKVLVRCRARLEVLSESPRAAVKDRVAAARGAAIIAQQLIVLVGLDKKGENQAQNQAAIDAARKAASQAVTLDLFGQSTPMAPPPFVTKVGDTNPHRGLAGS
jgi:hypothetical protein